MERTPSCDYPYKPAMEEELTSLTEGLSRVCKSPARPSTRFTVGGEEFAPGALSLIFGPCSVESWMQLSETVAFLREEGIKVIRGGAFKPRTSPYAFQGLGEEGLSLLGRAREEYGVAICTEVLSTDQVERVAEVADLMQVGSRSMQNFALLRELGRLGKPVLLKRAMSATYHEWLSAAEYLLVEGVSRVVLCERGVRGFEPTLRFQIDVLAPAVLHQVTHLPVIVDPSHATGDYRFVEPAALAAVAAGADGLLVEVHPNRDEALCDGPQALDFNQARRLIRAVRQLHHSLKEQGQTEPAPARLGS